jgi:hypothetical protein
MHVMEMVETTCHVMVGNNIGEQIYLEKNWRAESTICSLRVVPFTGHLSMEESEGRIAL